MGFRLNNEIIVLQTNILYKSAAENPINNSNNNNLGFHYKHEFKISLNTEECSL